MRNTPIRVHQRSHLDTPGIAPTFCRFGKTGKSGVRKLYNAAGFKDILQVFGTASGSNPTRPNSAALGLCIETEGASWEIVWVQSGSTATVCFDAREIVHACLQKNAHRVSLVITFPAKRVFPQADFEERISKLNALLDCVEIDLFAALWHSGNECRLYNLAGMRAGNSHKT